MAVGQADLLQSINVVWDASTLDATFKALWPATPDGDDFPVLHDMLAGGEQPWPYCMIEVQSGVISDWMTKGTNDLWRIEDVPAEFRVFATEVSGDSRSAKGIAAYLVEEIMKVFGGHPTVVSDDLTLDNGNHLVTLYQSDFFIREDNARWMGSISYLFRNDVQEMA